MSLIEAIAFLGVTAIVVSGVLALFGPGFTSAQATRLIGEATTVADNVRDLYASQSGYTSVSMTNLAQANVFPATLRVNGSGSSATVTNTWGGEVSVYAKNNGAVLQYEGVPSDVCTRVLMAGGNWQDLLVNGTDLETAAPTPQAAAQACNNGAQNTIGWLFE